MDNMYPNDGQAYLPQDDPVITEAAKIARQELSESLPFIDNLVDWFDDQIAGATNIENIDLTKLTINGVTYETKVSIEAQVFAHQLLKRLLEQKKVEYITFREQQSDFTK